LPSPLIRQGTIVQAFIVPPRGEPKWRPAVVYTPTALLAAASIVDVVGISGSYYPDDPEQVLLPWRADGNCPTRLTRPSSVQLNLTASVPIEHVRPSAAYVPGKELQKVLVKLAERGFKTG